MNKLDEAKKLLQEGFLFSCTMVTDEMKEVSKNMADKIIDILHESNREAGRDISLINLFYYGEQLTEDEYYELKYTLQRALWQVEKQIIELEYLKDKNK